VQLNLNRPRDKPPCLTVGRFDSTDVQVADAAAWLGAPRPIGGSCRAGLSDDDLSVAAHGCPGSFDLRVEEQHSRRRPAAAQHTAWTAERRR